MSRLLAAGHIRHLALAGADDLGRSRALLAELSALLTCYYRRVREFGGEAPQRVGPLVELHRELARAHLQAAGVEA